MDALAVALLQRAEEEEFTRHLEQVRMAREITAERKRLAAARVDPAKPASRPASRPRRRFADLFRTPRRPVRLA
ncbi:hypothetical protein [Xylanimonas sp. McL0601]|uniref:hypothetical protein n=1 Tax=Xylanimonas sp. McL0601 TaxID=3414739 RepID=UPI003CF3BAC6